MDKYLKIGFFVFALGFGLNASAQSYSFQNNLRTGTTGDDVTSLQTWLIANGFDIPAISNSQANKGYFGSQTKDAVAAYQLSVGLPGTGYFGPLTREKINNKDIGGSAFNIISPNGKETWAMGSTHAIRWNAPQFIRATYVDINLIPYISRPKCPTGFVCRLDDSTAEFTSSIGIARNISIDDRSFTWLLSSNLMVNDYIVQICQTGTSICTESKSPFKISEAIPQPLQLTVVSPNGGENWTIGTTRTISWKLKDGADQDTKVNIYLAAKSDVICSASQVCSLPLSPALSLITLDENIPSNAPYNWIVGTDMTNRPIAAGHYELKICIVNGACDTSDRLFTLSNSAPESGITVVSPNGNENWEIGTTRNISWKLVDGMDTKTKVDIYLEREQCKSGQTCTTQYREPILLDKNISSNTAYNWIVGTDIINNLIQANTYKMRICLAGSYNCDFSDNYFNLIK